MVHTEDFEFEDYGAACLVLLLHMTCTNPQSREELYPMWMCKRKIYGVEFYAS